MEIAVRFERVSRYFGEVRAVDDVSLEVRAGEFFAMLGPSGSGKTTCLRLIAGFERPSAGHIEIFGVQADRLPPFERDVNTVFQDYALFPHMNVLDNVCYGLMVRGVAKRLRRERARAMLALVRLEGFEQRRPSQLSGGQRQRVALARALINQPKVLLLDEPLGALDLKLREEMQSELKALQRALGITFVFVTHDQGEALSMSDRVAVFNKGRIAQIDTPEAIYARPATRFVADFVGQANVIEAENAIRLIGRPGPFALRPERIRLLASGVMPEPGWLTTEGRVLATQYHGSHTRYEIKLLDGLALAAQRQNEAEPASIAADGRVRLAWRPDDMTPLMPEPEVPP
jgi:putative spermidine/putrescine transport system ATP-binding protein